jgi:hypothetical protein
MMQLDDGLSVQLMRGIRYRGLHKMMLEVHRGVSLPSHALAYVGGQATSCCGMISLYDGTRSLRTVADRSATA